MGLVYRGTMPHLPRLLALALATAPALAACGGSGDDAPDVDAGTPATTTITIHAYGSQLLAIREVDGDWTALTPGADGDATADVAGPYQLVSVCDEPDFFDYYTIFAGVEDVEVDAFCTDAIDPVTVSFEPSNLQVSIGYRTSYDGSPLEVTAGTYDVVAIDAESVPQRILIQHDVELAADTSLTFDLAADGVELRTATVTATLGDQEQLAGSTQLRTKRETWVSMFHFDDQAPMVPASALGPDDRESVSAFVIAASPSGRSAAVAVSGDETTIPIVFPEPMTSATATWDVAPRASWVAPGTWENRYFYVSDADYTIYWDSMVRPGWIAAGGDDSAVEIADPSELPGWKASWSTSRPAGAEWTVLLSSGSGDGNSQNVNWSETFDAKAARPHRALPPRLGARVAR
jgi:hypothetical protein